MAIRFQLLRQEDVPMACQLIQDAGEWAPKSPIFDSPMDVLMKPRSQWMSALSADELVGVVGFYDISWPDGTAAMFTGLVPKLRGRGFSLALGKAQLDFAFNDMGLRRLEMSCLEGSPSAKLASKMGVKPEGRHPNTRLKAGKYHASVTFGLERSAYVVSKS